MHGQGSLEYDHASQYIGMFSENQRNGKGSFYYNAIKCEYHGEWENDLKDGSGVFVST